jgi:hypothetical protein
MRDVETAMSCGARVAGRVSDSRHAQYTMMTISLPKQGHFARLWISGLPGYIESVLP